MHRLHHEPKDQDDPQTAGATIHWTSQYDIFARLMGLGVNGSNSRMIVEMAQIKPGSKILDVGCGTGDLMLTAQKYAGASGSAYGIDASTEGIKIARNKAEREGSGAIFEVGLIEKIPYPEATFDLVVSRLVIHHLPNDLKRRGFKEIYRVLKPGGLLFLVDFKPPTNPILAHVAMALVGHRMMNESRVGDIPPMLRQTGFVDVTSGPTRSSLLAFVSGKKPENQSPSKA